MRCTSTKSNTEEAEKEAEIKYGESMCIDALQYIHSSFPIPSGGCLKHVQPEGRRNIRELHSNLTVSMQKIGTEVAMSSAM